MAVLPIPARSAIRPSNSVRCWTGSGSWEQITWATGHYARVEQDAATGRYLLKRGLDRSKDQSYFLYMLTQEQLAHTLFPLGSLEKTQVRQLAEAHGLVNAHKHDSQDICFVPDGDYAAFIERTVGTPSLPGNFVDQKGQVLGHHRGIIRYTHGQHKGLGLSYVGAPSMSWKRMLSAIPFGWAPTVIFGVKR